MVIIIKTFDKIHFQLGGSHVAKESEPHQPKKRRSARDKIENAKPKKISYWRDSFVGLWWRDVEVGVRVRGKGWFDWTNGYAEAIPSSWVATAWNLEKQQHIIGRVTSLLCTRSFWKILMRKIVYGHGKILICRAAPVWTLSQLFGQKHFPSHHLLCVSTLTKENLDTTKMSSNLGIGVPVPRLLRKCT